VVYDARLDLVLRLGEAAVGTYHEELDVLVHHLLKDGVGVVAVHDGPVGLGVVGGLGAQLAPEELKSKMAKKGNEKMIIENGRANVCNLRAANPHLVHLPRVAVQTERHLADVGDDGFATVALALMLAEDGGHFVAVLGIIHLFDYHVAGREEGGGRLSSG